MKIFTKISFIFGILFLCVSFIHAQDYVQIKVTSPNSVDWVFDATHGTGGPYFTESISGEVAMAFDATSVGTDGDTWSPDGFYCCDSIINPGDIAGKIALVGRGACSFVDKVNNAQAAGAIAMIVLNRAPLGALIGAHRDGLITMQTDALPVATSIPNFFISYEDREELLRLVDLGPVTLTFDAVPMYDAVGPDAYATPITQVTPIDSMRVSTFTRGPDTLTNVTFQVEITDPSSNVTTFTETVAELLPGMDTTLTNTAPINEPLIRFDGSYTPTEVGEYTMVYSASTTLGNHPLDNTTITKTFEVTDYTFAIDNGVVTDLDGIQMNTENYELGDAVFNVGSFYRMGAGGTSTYSSFAVANPGDLGNAGVTFTMQLFDADEDLDEILDTDFQLNSPVAEAEYTMTGGETANGLIAVPWDAPVTLNANGVYCIMVNGGEGENFDAPPAYSSAGDDSYVFESTAVEYNGVFEPDGFEYWNDDSNVPGSPTPEWSTTPYGKGGRHPIVRLHMDGFVGVDEIGLLDDSKINMYPTLTNSDINIELNLDNSSDVDVVISDLMGRKVFANTYNNVLNQTLNISVDGFSSGTYLISFTTAEGGISKKFVVAQ